MLQTDGDAADGGETHVHIGMGLVPDVFTEEALQHLPGDVAIGHIRFFFHLLFGHLRMIPN